MATLAKLATMARTTYTYDEVAAINRSHTKIALALRNSLVMLIAYMDSVAAMSLYTSTDILSILDTLDPECPAYDPDMMFSAFERGHDIVSNFPPI